MAAGGIGVWCATGRERRLAGANGARKVARKPVRVEPHVEWPRRRPAEWWRMGETGRAEPARPAARIESNLQAMITTGKAYDEREAFKVTPAALHKRLKHLQNQAAALGLQLIAA